MLKEIPNILTMLRIFLIPVLVISFYFEDIIGSANYIAAGIFAFASITDYVDGKLARHWQAQSNFGRMLDPIADKMLVASTLVMLVDRAIAPVTPIIAILCREIFVSGMRGYLTKMDVHITSSMISKCKTAIQMISIILLLLGKGGNGVQYAHQTGCVLLWIAAILTLLSGYLYINKYIPRIISLD